MAFLLNAAGPTTILNSSSTGPGSWYRINPNSDKLSVHVTHTGTSVGTSVGSTVYIEVSNDGTNPLGDKAGTLVFGTTTPVSNDRSPAVNGFAIDAHWAYIRGNINSLTTGAVAVIVDARRHP